MIPISLYERRLASIARRLLKIEDELIELRSCGDPENPTPLCVELCEAESRVAGAYFYVFGASGILRRGEKP